MVSMGAVLQVPGFKSVGTKILENLHNIFALIRKKKKAKSNAGFHFTKMMIFLNSYSAPEQKNLYVEFF